jgi:hypothetical protein
MKYDPDRLTPGEKVRFERLLKEITRKRWAAVFRSNIDGLDNDFLIRWIGESDVDRWGIYLQREREIREKIKAQ